MAQEERIEKFEKYELSLVQANLAESSLNDGKKPQAETVVDTVMVAEEFEEEDLEEAD